MMKTKKLEIKEEKGKEWNIKFKNKDILFKKSNNYCNKVKTNIMINLIILYFISLFLFYHLF